MTTREPAERSAGRGNATGGAVHDQFRCFLDALEPGAVLPLLRDALGGVDGTNGNAGACEVLDAKYEPGRASPVLYRVGSRLVRGTVLPDGELRVAVFPEDPDLPTLPAVVDRDSFVPLLRDALVRHGADLHDAELSLLRYRPGRRATFLVTADLGTRVARYVAKVYHDPRKAAAVASEGLSLMGQGDADLTLAPLVAHLPSVAVVVQGHLAGTVLRTDQVRRVEARAELDRAARALAALHRRTLPAGRTRPLDRELQRFVMRATAVRAVSPRTGDALLGLARRLLACRWPAAPVSLVHGDCRPGQFLLVGDSVALLDLDHLGLADAASDVGNFVASLQQQALRGPFTASASLPDPAALDAADTVAAWFLTTYASAAGARAGDDLADRADLYVAVALMRKALRAFARAPLSALPRRYVGQGHRVLDHREVP